MCCMGQLPPTQELKRLYYDEGLTQFEIADRFDVGQPGVSQAMRRADINPGHEANRVPYASFYTAPNGYEHWSSRDTQGGYEYVKVHRLLAVAEYGFDAAKDMHVHHQNKCRWDNRADNISLLTPESHQSHHNKEEVKARERDNRGRFV